MTTKEPIPAETIRLLAKEVEAFIDDPKKKDRFLEKIRESDGEQKKRRQEQERWDKRLENHLRRIAQKPEWQLESVSRRDITGDPPKKGWEPIMGVLHDPGHHGVVRGWGPCDFLKRPPGRVNPWDFDEQRDADLAEQYYVLAVVHDSVYRQPQFQLVPLALKPELKPPKVEHKKRLWGIKQYIYQDTELKKPSQIGGEHEPILHKYMESIKEDLGAQELLSSGASDGRPDNEAAAREWLASPGFVGTKVICNDKRFQKHGKNPPRTTIDVWVKRAPPTETQKDPASGELYLPERWVFDQISRWNPRERKPPT